MSQKMFQGRTLNHLTWVMVDSTDFATPESALSTAKIMAYGKLRSTSLVYFVSSGTGSMVGGDIKHVGLSATGVYTVPLAKGDLSDASAAWYDQYTFIITGTGAAQQVLVCEGILSAADVERLSALVSDVQSAVAVGAAGVTVSNISDIASAVWAAKYTGNSVASSFGSMMSDLYSRLVKTQSNALQASSRASDIRSRIDSASFLSDIASHVWTAKYTGLSAASSFGSLLSDINSRIKGNSDFLSKMSDMWSNTRTVAIQTNSRVSHLRSRVDSASFLSDIASHVWTATYTNLSAAGSFGSLLSDMNSRIKGNSDFLSKMSDVWSDTLVAANAAASRTTQILNEADNDQSVLVSRLRIISTLTKGTSDFLSKMSDVWSDTLVAATQGASRASDIRSRMDSASYLSDIASHVWTAKYTALSAPSSFGSLMSDIRSAVGAINVSIGPSEISDIASAVAAGLTGVTPSDIGNIATRVWSDFQSKVGRSVSDVMSDLLNTASDVQSAVALIPKSDGALLFNVFAVGDIKAGLATQAVVLSNFSDLYELLSDVDSAANSQFTILGSRMNLANSRLLVNQSTASNIYELISDMDSALTSQAAFVNAHISSGFDKIYSDVSDLDSALASQFVITNSQLDVNVITVNDIYSLLSAVNSDIGARIPKEVAARSQLSDLASDLKSAIAAGGSTSAIYAMLSDFQSDFQSRVPKEVASASALTVAKNSIYSMLSDVSSDIGVMSGVLSDTYSAIGAITVDGNAIADAILDRDMAAGADTGTALKRTPRQALRFLRNKWSVVGAGLKVFKEDDTTESWSATLATTPGADPITGNDPEG